MLELTLVRPPDGFKRYDLVQSFLRLRKQIFVDKMGWPLYDYEEIEFEQYDSFTAAYIIAHEGDDVLGGARLIRTDQMLGSGKLRYSYMIRDACLGLLPGMPTTLCTAPPPQDNKIWELTRLVTVAGKEVARPILLAVNEFLITENASTCLFLGPPAFIRMAKSMNFSPVPLGPIVRNEDGKFLAFSCRVLGAPNVVGKNPISQAREPLELIDGK